ncbi:MULTISPECIES: nucleotide exchange factor GrpE [unclassified Butyrivibrio]|uniref:nucleotide exchange factor GrpE n=1 Tax=unclassified Butyrivibrio TaxID=2639466 RepID=UPI00041A7D32|nr:MULTISPECIES: nucleotide exchange factor GrpE [unclassified Butyrivibrio]SDB35826.1 molecular chaperone GrpE [Butyrivibrio sp. INlla16]SEK79399.1 molecular chaperone GrpE [Butyrivibrio sp. ob235]
MSKEVKKDTNTVSGKKTAKELQQEVAEKAKKVADAANKVAEAAEEEAAEAVAEAAESVEGAENTENAEGEKKGLFGKKEKKNPYKEKFEEMQDKYMRQLAEFENFRTRTDREKAQMFNQGASSVLEKILPVVDNFERGLAAVPEEEKNSAFADGMNMIYKQLMKQIEDLGVTPIEAVGKEFDPNFHNAVMQVESEDVEEGFVAQELQKGYMYHDTVLRHSMVAVAK